ncbi:WRKY transcription factor [Populus alba x Populus x berolinensis]|uniref:WRKY transcription factor n=1 Tax=Populus alba x Populus x berolinensis TaxID=444605 RepID=A0AAD6LKM7_9ROSI|nr:WRKY transcription factor [Populus alba x Populus x berolinensis]
MEGEVNSSSWFSESEEDELVRELLDDASPFFFLPEERNQSKAASLPPRNEEAMNQLISKVYSGPTMQDIENDLSMTSRRDQPQPVSQARYTVKLKSCDNGVAGDGYKWRKYGQKSIKNSTHPRSYYKCTNPRCGAKKQVERSGEDPDTLVITYEGLHLHFSHPFFLSNQPQHFDPPSKKPKRTISEDEFQAHETRQPPEQGQECSTHVTSSGSLPSSSTANDYMQESDLEAMGPRGLLEDVVPFMIRNPSSYNVSSYCSSSSHRSPPTSPSSSLSWSPNLSHSCFDVGLNTSIG